MNLVHFAIAAIGISIFSAFVKMGNPILSAYLMSVLVVVLFFIFLLKGYLFGKKYTIQPSEKLTQKEKDFIEKHKLVFEIIARSIYFALVIGGFTAFVVPCIKDLPALIKDDYSFVTGVAVEKVDENGDRKIVRLKDSENGNIISIIVNYKEINIGQEYTIKYLPNIERGEIILVSPAE